MISQYLPSDRRPHVRGDRSDDRRLEVGLGRQAVSGLTPVSTVADVGSWRRATVTPGCRPAAWRYRHGRRAGRPINLPPACWTNSGEAGWPDVNCVFVTATVDGTERLMLAEAAGASPLQVGAGQTVGFAGNALLIPFQGVR